MNDVKKPVDLLNQLVFYLVYSTVRTAPQGQELLGNERVSSAYDWLSPVAGSVASGCDAAASSASSLSKASCALL